MPFQSSSSTRVASSGSGSGSRSGSASKLVIRLAAIEMTKHYLNHRRRTRRDLAATRKGYIYPSSVHACDTSVCDTSVCAVIPSTSWITIK